jgi:signal transduction histidine kinase
MFGLIVHDLRNPAATLAANIGFVREGLDDPTVPPAELGEALNDSQQALADLMRGLDQLVWMGRAFNGRPAAGSHTQELAETFANARKRIKHGAVEFRTPERPVRVSGGEALERLIELLVSNGHQHAPGKLVLVSAQLEEGEPGSAPRVSIEIHDQGRPLAPEFHEPAFTLPGQLDIKGRADGRYGRVLALYTAGLLAQALGARIRCREHDGHNVFRIELNPG